MAACLCLLTIILSAFSKIVWSIDSNETVQNKARVDALFSLDVETSRNGEGALKIYGNSKVKLRVVGSNLTEDTVIAFTTTEHAKIGEECDHPKFFDALGIHGSVVEYEVTLSAMEEGEFVYFLCIRESVQTSGSNYYRYQFQGSSPELQVISIPRPKKTTLLPMGLQIVILVLLLTLSGLFSGLNLGLMALDKTELQIIEKCGKPSEKRYAKIISPLRKRGNFLLCTLLLGNVLVNNTLTILLDDLTNGLLAVVGATLGIVIFGEIVPQALCSRHGLAVGARTILITKLFMILTFPLSYPISVLLDRILGEEMGQVYNREKLQELIKVNKEFSQLEPDELNIISGALELAKKTVADVMTKIEDVFMLDIKSVIDFDKMSDIMKRGYTRIPVYEEDSEGSRTIMGLLNIKDLAFVDPDDKTPLSRLINYYNHQPIFIFDDHKLQALLQEFRSGRSHMAIVQKLVSETDKDPRYENIGVVTLEDVIEEIIQSEIIDESDTITDNRGKKKVRLEKHDFTDFNQPDEEHRPRLSPQMAVAAFQYLSTAVEPFKKELISEDVLKKLMQMDIVKNKHPQHEGDGSNFLLVEGQPADCFIFLLQGYVEVTVGKENLKFEAGAFTSFGVSCLINVNERMARSSDGEDVTPKYEQFVPDFSLRVVSDIRYLLIRTSHYHAARRATILKESYSDGEDPFKNEWNQVSIHHENSNNNSAEQIKSISNLTPEKSIDSVDKFVDRTFEPISSDVHSENNQNDAGNLGTDDLREVRVDITSGGTNGFQAEGDNEEQIPLVCDKPAYCHV